MNSLTSVRRRVLLVGIICSIITGCEQKSNRPVIGSDWLSPATGTEFVWIPKLKMWVGKYEVTNGEYRKKDPGHNSPSYSADDSLNGDRQPVVVIAATEADAYAKWMTERDRAEGCISTGYEYRLPTREEWVTFVQCDDGRQYPWGNDWLPRTGYAGNYMGDNDARLFVGRQGPGIKDYSDGSLRSCDVEQSWKNPWGLYGVGGNVEEFVYKADGFGIMGSSYFGENKRFEATPV